MAEPKMMEAGIKRLTSSEGRDVGAVYSPEGGRIVWVTDSLGNWTIWVMNDDGTGKQQLTPSNVISGWPSWSPDGGEIAYWSWDPASKTCDIWKVRSDGSSRVKLTVDGSFKGPPMWSPRGDRIAYTANQTGNMEVYVMKTDGAGIRQLTRGHNPEYWVESRTTWHPDGVHLYYQVTTFPLPPLTVPEIKDDVAFVEIFMLNVDTGEERNLTPRLHENVRSISKDGKMACISLRSPNYGLWIMNEDGTGQTRLTWNGKGDRAPRITPDGKKIVYWSLASGNPDIWVINSDGTNNTQLTRSPYMDIYPQWSPDGKKIIFESDRAGNFDIWQLSLNDPVSVSVDFGKCVVLGSMGKASLTGCGTKLGGGCCV
jgi:TolB protein